MKDQIENADPVEPSFSPICDGPGLLVGFVKAATKSEILMALPIRSVVDRLVDAYFRLGDMGAS